MLQHVDRRCGKALAEKITCICDMDKEDGITDAACMSTPYLSTSTMTLDLRNARRCLTNGEHHGCHARWLLERCVKTTHRAQRTCSLWSDKRASWDGNSGTGIISLTIELFRARHRTPILPGRKLVADVFAPVVILAELLVKVDLELGVEVSWQIFCGCRRRTIAAVFSIALRFRRRIGRYLSRCYVGS